MKNKENIKKKKRIEDFIVGISWMFQINNYEKEIIFEEKNKKAEDETREVQAEVDICEKYQTITIRLYPRFFDLSLDEQRKTLLHELCHCLTGSSNILLQDFYNGKFVTPQQINSSNERETSQIENILDRLLTNRLNYAKKAYNNYLKKI